MVDVDLAIIGCGPAGLSAARAATLNGIQTHCFDKKTQLGREVRCAEGIGKQLLSLSPYSIPSEFIEWELEGFRFVSDNLTIECRGDIWAGYSLNRSKFEPWLANTVSSKGGTIHAGYELVSLEEKKGHINQLTFKHNGKLKQIKPKRVIIADGAKSHARELLGLDKCPQTTAAVHSFEIEGIKLSSPELEHVFFGKYSPKGYSYIFPKDKTRANIGCGSIGVSPEQAKQNFDRFCELSEVKQAIASAKYVKEKSGIAEIDQPTTSWVGENYLIAGDAGNQNLKPFVEGILPAIIMGDYAGRVISTSRDFNPDKYTRENNPITEYYSQSDQLWELFQTTFNQKEDTKHLLLLALSANRIADKTALAEWRKLKKPEIVARLLESGAKLIEN